ncbi:MAG: DNA translocase FtsK 4TM domain-containing protein [Bacilli bacterium]|nr:DNA translocase FtsK 4TM domain-containing protein [Bacilli bacterium]
MAKKKTSSSSKKKGKIPVEIFGILYIVLTILGLLRSGFVGRMVSNFGIFLFGAYYNWGIVFFLIVGGYVLLFREKPHLFKKKLIGFYLISIAVLSMSHVRYIMYDTNIGSAVFQDTIANIVSGFNDVNFIQGGGILGAMFSYLFVLAFDVLGSKIVCWVLILFGVMLIFNLSFSAVLKKIILFFTPKKWLNKNKGEVPSEENEEPEEEPVKDKRVVISSVNDLSHVNLEEEQVALEPAVKGEYKLPPLSLLDLPKKVNTKANEENIASNIKLLEQVLTDFDINGKVVEAHVGPTVTQYELEIKSGTKVNKILSLNKEIALALAAKDVRIQAPIPGKSTIGIDIPNKVTSPVSLREVLASVPKEKVDSKLLAVLGKDIMGNPRWMEVNKTPHLLIAGATGSGKSVCVNSVITSILMRSKPDEVKLVMVDPKKVELSMYNGTPHLLTPVVTDPKKASIVLKKIVEEMEHRYELLSDSGTKNIEGYNRLMDKKNETGEGTFKRLPYIVVLIDELADLMLVAAKEVEDSIMRITQMARAAGIHLIVATQRPSTDVITGVVKANIPSRIAFTVSSSIDSRTILDMTGAEKLIGKGDMLFLPMGEGTPTRIQGSFISEEEVQRVVDYTVKQQKAQYDEKFTNLTDKPAGASSYDEKDDSYDDPLYNEIVDFVIKSGKTSASLLQRKYRLGYNRAARMIDLLEERGIVGPPNGSKPREVLVKYENQDDNEEEQE